MKWLAGIFLVALIASANCSALGIKDIASFLFGGGYSGYPDYPDRYPGQGYPGQGYPGQGYPYPRPPGPPGAHPGCPLCDSSVYSYCSHKQAHDACCCDGPSFLGFGCRNTDCRYLHANSCKEYDLISECCCVDVQKAVPVAERGIPVIDKTVPVQIFPVPAIIVQ